MAEAGCPYWRKDKGGQDKIRPLLQAGVILRPRCADDDGENDRRDDWRGFAHVRLGWIQNRHRQADNYRHNRRCYDAQFD